MVYDNPSASTFAAVEKTNWDRCFLCQQVTKEKLIQPSLFNREHNHTGYATLARNVPLFHMINSLPVLLSPARLDDGDGIENTLIRNRATFRASCRLMFNNSKFERAQKRASTAAEETEDPKRYPCQEVKKVSVFEGLSLYALFVKMKV